MKRLNITNVGPEVFFKKGKGFMKLDWEVRIQCFWTLALNPGSRNELLCRRHPSAFYNWLFFSFFQFCKTNKQTFTVILFLLDSQVGAMWVQDPGSINCKGTISCFVSLFNRKKGKLFVSPVCVSHHATLNTVVEMLSVAIYVLHQRRRRRELGDVCLL